MQEKENTQRKSTIRREKEKKKGKEQNAKRDGIRNIRNETWKALLVEAVGSEHNNNRV